MRGLLGAAATGLAAGLAGCSFGGESTSTPGGPPRWATGLHRPATADSWELESHESIAPGAEYTEPSTVLASADDLVGNDREARSALDYYLREVELLGVEADAIERHLASTANVVTTDQSAPFARVAALQVRLDRSSIESELDGYGEASGFGDYDVDRHDEHRRAVAVGDDWLLHARVGMQDPPAESAVAALERATDAGRVAVVEGTVSPRIWFQAP